MSALKGHPKGLYLIFATSTAERFSYYGMRAIFILFLTQALLFDKEAAASIYGSYTGLVYLTPLIGGYIADKYWGIRRSVFWGAMMMAVGQFLMFMSASTLDNTELAHWMMYGGLGFLILGNGCFKPTVSSLVGQLYEPGDRRLDAATVATANVNNFFLIVLSLLLNFVFVSITDIMLLEKCKIKKKSCVKFLLNVKF